MQSSIVNAIVNRQCNRQSSMQSSIVNRHCNRQSPIVNHQSSVCSLQSTMKIGILTNEYPPNVYGGAGVHVEYLTRELAGLGHAVHVLSFGDQDEAAGTRRVEGVQPPVE